MNTQLLPWRRLFSWHSPLSAASRLRVTPGAGITPISVSETAVLLACGATAAAAVLMLDFKLQLPGHAILRAVFPLALGLALVPRRGAATVMGAGAVSTAAALVFGGWGEKGLGSMTSLCVIGPLVDLAVSRSSTGRRVYLSFITAGVLTNLAALAVQASAKYFGFGGGGGKSLAVWLPMALVTYPVFGAVAGLVSAAAWFRWNAPASADQADERS